MKRIILSTILTLIFSFTGNAQENSETTEPDIDMAQIQRWYGFAAEGIECMGANEELMRLINVHKSFNGVFKVENIEAISMVEERLAKNVEILETLVFGVLGAAENAGVPEEDLLLVVTQWRTETAEKIHHRRGATDPQEINDIIKETFEYVRWCRKWAKDALGEAAPN